MPCTGMSARAVPHWQWAKTGHASSGYFMAFTRATIARGSALLAIRIVKFPAVMGAPGADFGGQATHVGHMHPLAGHRADCQAAYLHTLAAAGRAIIV